MLTIIRHFRLAIRTVISDYVLDILRGANIKEGTDKYLSSSYLYNKVNKYILMTFKTLGEILRGLEREKKIKRKDSEIEGASKSTKKTLWTFNA